MEQGTIIRKIEYFPHVCKYAATQDHFYLFCNDMQIALHLKDCIRNNKFQMMPYFTEEMNLDFNPNTGDNSILYNAMEHIHDYKIRRVNTNTNLHKISGILEIGIISFGNSQIYKIAVYMYII